MLQRLLVADLKMMVRNRAALFWALMFPIMFATIFGLFNFDQLPSTEILLRSKNPTTGRAIEAGLRQVPSIEFTDESYASDAAARDAVRSGDLDFVLDVAANGNVTVLVNSSAADINRIFVPIFERVVDEI
ncbi:MAG TPA: hypothetical protein VM600_06325, partial [Actinomycetota bacterium]|nr:hypothetical protein [Actinomycetota bacterium]